MQANTLKGKRGQLGPARHSSFGSPHGTNKRLLSYSPGQFRRISPTNIDSEDEEETPSAMCNLDDSSVVAEAPDGNPSENFWEGIRRMTEQQRLIRQKQSSAESPSEEKSGRDSPVPAAAPEVPQSPKRHHLHIVPLTSLNANSFKGVMQKQFPQLVRAVERFGKATLIAKDSSWKFKWDLYVGILIFYSVMVVPLRIGFPKAEEKMGPGSQTCGIDSVVDICFVLDMIFVFNQVTEVHIEGEEIQVRDRWGITKKYLKTWFTIDFLSTFPFDKVASGGSWDSCAEEETDGGGGSERAIKLIRVFRLIRLLKLMRILKLGRIMENLPLDDIPPSVWELGTLVLKTTFVAHLLCCFWFFTASDTFVDPETSTELTWTQTENMLNQTLEMQYVTSFYWTIATMLAVGYGDVHAVNSGERIYSIFAQLIGSVVFGAVIGTVSNLVRSRDPQGRARKERVDALKHYLAEREIPPAMSKKAREALDYFMHHRSVFNEMSILDSLPSHMYNVVVCQVYNVMLARIPVLKNAEADFVANIVTHLKPSSAMNHEVLFEEGELSDEIDFVTRGDVLLYRAEGELEAHDIHHELKSSNVNIFDFDPHQVLNGRCCSGEDGSYFGDYEVVRRTARVFTAVATSNVSYMSISRANLDSVIQRFPIPWNDFLFKIEERTKCMLSVLSSTNSSFVPKKQRHARAMRKEKIYLWVNGRTVKNDKVPLQRRNDMMPKHHNGNGSAITKQYSFTDVDGEDDDATSIDEEETKKPVVVHTTRRKDPNDPSQSIYDEESTEDLWKRYIFDPNSPRKQHWDIGVGVLIVYSVTVIPFRIGFNMEDPAYGSLDYWIFLIIDYFFFIDIVVNFRTAYYDVHDDCVVTEPQAIWKHYMKSWFTVDFCSCIDVEFIMSPKIIPFFPFFIKSGGGQLGSTKMLKAIRLFRLLKLVRLMKLGRYLELIEDELGIPPALFDLLMLFVQVAFLAHLFACFFYFVASNNSEGTTLEDGDTWFRNDFLFPHQDTHEIYIGAIYWAFTTMTTVGYGDICAHPDSIAEKCYAIVMMAIGATVFAFVLANVAALSDSMGGSQAQVRAHLVHVTEYLEEKTVPLGMHPAIKAHWKFVLASSLGMDEGQLLEQLPTRMAQQILFLAHEQVIEKICIFRTIEQKSIILHIFRLMDPCYFVNGGTLFEEGGMANDVYFITDGVVELTKRVITGTDVKAVTIAHVETGGFVGHSGLMLSARQPYTAKAIDGGCECYSLSNNTISNITQDLPFVAIHLQFALSTAMAEQDEHLTTGARQLRAERLRNIDSPTTVKFVERLSERSGSGRSTGRISPMTAGTPTRTPTSRPSLVSRSGSRTMSSSPGGARRSMSMSPSMSRGESSSFDSDGNTQKPPMKIITTMKRRLTTTFSAKVAIEQDDAAPEANPIDGILDVHASENIKGGRISSVPRSISCPELESGYGISSTTSKGKPLLGLGVEEAALRSQGDSRTIYRNRSISRMAPDSVEN